MANEKEILNLIKNIVPNSTKYLNDDAAIIKINNKNLVFTTDTFVENTHFKLKTSTFKDIGWKSMAINLSDIASMGAKPLYALVSLSLPKNMEKKKVNSLYKGIQDCAKKYKTQIIGGNLTRSKLISINITVIGEVKNAGERSNAKIGDIVFTSGNHGDSAFGFSQLNKKNLNSEKKKIISKHLKPKPKIKLGETICKTAKRIALMDSSDGLADCLIQIADSSKVKISIKEELLPVSTSLKKLKLNYIDLVLFGGEDYELVGTASKEDWEKLSKFTELKKIGTVEKGKGAYLITMNGKTIKLEQKKVFQHFKT